MRVEFGRLDAGNGNLIDCSSELQPNITVNFQGTGNTLRLLPGCKAKSVYVYFPNDNGYVEIGSGGSLTATLVCAYNSIIRIADDVTTTNKVTIIAGEQTSITIGRDTMIARDVFIRSDDAHAIYDVESGKRVNKARDIIVGEHVWLGNEAVVLGGSEIGNGSVAGWRSVIKGVIPNNCIVAGVPAVVRRRNIAWERPHLFLTKPWIKDDIPEGKRSIYWRRTDDETD